MAFAVERFEFLQKDPVVDGLEIPAPFQSETASAHSMCPGRKVNSSPPFALAVTSPGRPRPRLASTGQACQEPRRVGGSNFTTRARGPAGREGTGGSPPPPPLLLVLLVSSRLLLLVELVEDPCPPASCAGAGLPAQSRGPPACSDGPADPLGGTVGGAPRCGPGSSELLLLFGLVGDTSSPVPGAGAGSPACPCNSLTRAGGPPAPVGGSASGSPVRRRRSLGRCHCRPRATLRFHSARSHRFVAVIDPWAVSPPSPAAAKVPARSGRHGGSQW